MKRARGTFVLLIPSRSLELACDRIVAITFYLIMRYELS